MHAQCRTSGSAGRLRTAPPPRCGFRGAARTERGRTEPKLRALLRELIGSRADDVLVLMDRFKENHPRHEPHYYLTSCSARIPTIAATGRGWACWPTTSSLWMSSERPPSSSRATVPTTIGMKRLALGRVPAGSSRRRAACTDARLCSGARPSRPPVRRTLLAAVVFAVTLTPAPASAAQGFAVVVGPVRVHHYAMTVPRDSLAIRAAPPSSTLYSSGTWESATLGRWREAVSPRALVPRRPGARVTIAPDLASATISARLGRFGRVDLAAEVPPPQSRRSCLGDSGEGTAEGDRPRLLPGGRYFGTIIRHRLPAIILGDGTCVEDARQRAARPRSPELYARDASARVGTRILALRSRTTSCSSRRSAPARTYSSMTRSTSGCRPRRR